MTTTGTTVKNAFFDGMSAANTVADTQKETDKTQNFGDVLGRTAQKMAAPSQQNQSNQVVAGSTKSKTQQSDKAAFKDSKNAGLTKDNRTVEDGADTDEAVEEKVSKTKEAPETEIINQMAEEPADEMTIDEIISALEQIMEQIKEILDITDEELLSGMEELGIQPVDLLNTDNMAQLVTTIAGEDSTISLVANEELYTAVQDLTETVGTQVNTLLENTGFTSEELDAILQKLQELESQNLEDQLQDAEILPMEGQDESAVHEEELAQTFDGPVIIKEDNIQSSDRAAKQYDKLPENQQENPVEIGTKPQTQNTEKDTKGSDDKDSKHFGQNGTAQDFQNNLNEVSDMTAAEGVEKFTSDSTESIMRQLADMVKIVRNENLTEMELQLHPASLGTVNVSLTTKGGMVTAEFTTQNEAVKAAIEAQASQLRANLEEQGVKIEAIEVSVESHQMERDLDKNGDQQQKQAQEQETARIQGIRRGRSSINLRAFADGEELEGEMQGADDATRIAMEIMAANGNTMDLLA